MTLISCTETLLLYPPYQVGELVVQVLLGVVILAHRSSLEQAAGCTVSLHQHPSALDYLKAKQGRRVVQDHHVHSFIRSLSSTVQVVILFMAGA